MKKLTLFSTSVIFFALLLYCSDLEAQTDFITTWKTTTTNESITIPTFAGETYNYSVDWGDGATDAITTDASPSHTYIASGTYTVTINGTFPRIYFNNAGDKSKIISIEQWGTNVWTSMNNAFFGCNYLVGNATDVPNLTNVADMSGMFYSSAFNQDIGNWNVSNATNMSGMFHYASTFNQDIGSWNVSNVTDMSYMFAYANSFNKNISTWNVGNATNMFGMFGNASAFNQNIGNWNVSKVTDMSYMFFGASAFDQNIGSWNVSNVTAMSNMFNGITLSTANYDALLNGWNALTLQNGVTFDGGNSQYCSGLTARNSMTSSPLNWTITDGGQNCSSTYFITTWKTDNASTGSSNSTFITIPTTGGGYNYDVSWKNDGVWETGFSGDATHDYGAIGTYTVAIRGAFPRIFFNNTGDRRKIMSIEQWGTNVWTSMNNAFGGCANLIGNATDVPNLSSVTDMSLMFLRATAFNQNIGNWNVGNVTDMNNMFYGATSFNQNIGNWNVSNVTNMGYMFAYATAFNQNIGNWNMGNVTSLRGMFYEATYFNQDIGNWNVANVITMNIMFSKDTYFNQNIGNWNVSNVTNMTDMFLEGYLSTANYDALLNGWNGLTLKNGVVFNGGNSRYCSSQQSRTNILSTYGWTITDGGLESGCPPLPINLIDFKAIANKSENSVHITWATLTESNNDYFTIERSKDGVAFEGINNISSGGNSNSRVDYADIDAHPLEGYSFYRLKQTDKDGKFTYSQIERVHLGDQSFSATISPNPTRDMIQLKIDGIIKKGLNYMLVDMVGKKIANGIITTNSTSIDLRNRAQGTYILQVIDEGKLVQTFKIIKTN